MLGMDLEEVSTSFHDVFCSSFKGHCLKVGVVQVQYRDFGFCVVVRLHHRLALDNPDRSRAGLSLIWIWSKEAGGLLAGRVVAHLDIICSKISILVKLLRKI